MVDCVGLLPKAKTASTFVWTVTCMSARFPEALPLRKITTLTLRYAHAVWRLKDWGEGVHLKLFKSLLALVQPNWFSPALFVGPLEELSKRWLWKWTGKK